MINFCICMLTRQLRALAYAQLLRFAWARDRQGGLAGLPTWCLISLARRKASPRTDRQPGMLHFGLTVTHVEGFA